MFKESVFQQKIKTFLGLSDLEPLLFQQGLSLGLKNEAKKLETRLRSSGKSMFSS